jgi:hypothetical protein
MAPKDPQAFVRNFPAGVEPKIHSVLRSITREVIAQNTVSDYIAKQPQVAEEIKAEAQKQLDAIGIPAKVIMVLPRGLRFDQPTQTSLNNKFQAGQEQQANLSRISKERDNLNWSLEQAQGKIELAKREATANEEANKGLSGNVLQLRLAETLANGKANITIIQSPSGGIQMTRNVQ